MVFKLGHFRRRDHKYPGILKYGAGQGWWSSIGPIMRGKEEILNRVKEGRKMLHITGRRKRTWFDHFLRRNFLLQHIVIGKVKRVRR
jgi:hypothetical protein